MPDTAVIIVIVSMVLVATLTAALVLVVVMRRRKAMAARAGKDTPLGQALQKPGKKSAATEEGVAYDFYFHPGGRNSSPSFSVTVPCPSHGAFQLGRESGFDRFAKRTGLAKEIQTGDADFDAKYFIQSSKEDFAAEFLQSAEKRQAIDLLLRIGFTLIKHDGKVMQAIWSPFALKDDMDESFVPNAATLLVALTQDLPQPAHAGPISSGPQGWRARRIIAFVIPFLAHMLGITTLMLALLWYKPLDVWWLILDSLKYSVPCLLLFCYIAVLLVRGRSTSHKELLFIVIFAVVGFPMTGMGMMGVLNGALDRAEPTEHVAEVLRTYITESDDNSKTYHAVLASWREGRDTEALTVSSSEYHRLYPGKTSMQVTTKPGRFGFEWIVSKAIAGK